MRRDRSSASSASKGSDAARLASSQSQRFRGMLVRTLSLQAIARKPLAWLDTVRTASDLLKQISASGV